MSGPRPASAPARERGFVLIGVVVMVLALTIIGISLYSLSGYESQFFTTSYGERQALYRASGGIEMVKGLLSNPVGSPAGYRLGNARLAEGREGVVSAIAWQDSPPDSTGDIDWNQDVHIRVSASVYGVTRTVHGLYRGSQQKNPYHFVFTCPGPITTQVEGNNRPLVLGGQVWQTIRARSDTAWTAATDWSSRYTFTSGDAPSPLVASYVASHPTLDSPAKQFPDSKDSTNFTLTLDASGAPGGIRYFSAYTDSNTASTALLPYADIFTQRLTHIRVAGTAVWVIPRGAIFENEFRIEKLGTGTATLIMVVGANGRWAGSTQVGPWFNKGIKIETPGHDDVNVFLVTDATARIRDEITTEDIFARSICVFASTIEFQGPPYTLPRRNMSLEYPDAMKNVANALSGVLPGYTGQVAGRFALRPGSWTESPGLQ